MVAYNFHERFADAVESGAKRQTIRAPRKDGRHARVGDELQLYTGMRTKACRKLRDAKCHDVCDVLIDEAGRFWSFRPQELLDINMVAKLDGFASGSEMLAWFRETHGLPFRGVMIRWLVPTKNASASVPSTRGASPAHDPPDDVPRDGGDDDGERG